MIKFGIPILKAGFTLTSADEVTVSNVQGGSRMRRNFIGGNRFVTVTFRVNDTGHRYIDLFFHSSKEKGGIAGGSLKFKIDLPVELFGCTEQIAQFVKGSLKLTSRKGRYDYYSATLEILTPRKESSLDSVFMALFGASGGDEKSMYGALDYSRCTVQNCYLDVADASTIH